MDTLRVLGFGVAAATATAVLAWRRTHKPEEDASLEDEDLFAADNRGLFKLDKDVRLKKKALETLAAKGTSPTPATPKRVYTVCLTGGPCSGKSSSLASLSKALTARGFDVYSVPEVPTIVMNSGFPYPGLEGGDLLMEFEMALARSQLQLEATTVKLARARDRLQRHRPCVIFFDRGLMDMKAYMSEELWGAMLGAFGLNEAVVMDRYDMVLHLETAAFGAELFYTTANNSARTETMEEARVNDTRVKDAWRGHLNWRHIPNRQGQGFTDKLLEATNAVLELVGAPPAQAL